MSFRSDISSPAFACDAMLGGVARWLRAAGYDAFWQYGIADADLVALALREGRWLLTSDLGILERRVITRGELLSLYIPRGTGAREQLGFVLGKLGLGVRGSRCMSCGGELARVSKGSVRDIVPERSWRRHEDFTRCRGCDKVFWQGTHWDRIAGRLREAAHAMPGRGVGVGLFR